MRRTRHALLSFSIITLCLSAISFAFAKEAGYHDVVKLVESYYHVKHRGMPFAANLGIKTAKITSSTVRRLMRFGDFKLAIFEDQDFTTRRGDMSFDALMRRLLEPPWQPLVVVRSQTEGQTFTYTKSDGDKFTALIVFIGQRDATVLQVDLAPEEFVKLLKNPEQESKEITDEATSAGDGDQE